MDMSITGFAALPKSSAKLSKSVVFIIYYLSRLLFIFNRTCLRPFSIGNRVPVVIRQRGHRGAILFLDGHVRIQILKDFGTLDTMCLIATDDEAFTYNKRISRLATIQEHRIAKALDVDVAMIRRKRRLLDGICPEVANLLTDRHCPINTFQSLKKMKPIRQMEVAQLMDTMNNYSVPYSRALLATTPLDQVVDAKRPKATMGILPNRWLGWKQKWTTFSVK